MLPDATQPLVAGQRLGPYRIEGLLGTGGMGMVYSAQDTARGRRVAVKVVDHSRHDPDAVRQLVREARLASLLDHPGICRVHDVGDVNGEPFIVMEHVRGEPLSTILQRGYALPPAAAVGYELQIVEAVAHAHDRGIVHGDIKSSNIMVSVNGRVKILDFGLAVQRPAAARLPAASGIETTGPPQPGSCTGTVPYMAPELLRGRPADVFSDIWALGVLFFEMLCGYRPYRGATVFELAAAILANDPQRPPPDAPPAALEVAVRCLHTFPADRYASARVLATELSRLVVDAEGLARQARPAAGEEEGRSMTAFPERAVS